METVTFEKDIPVLCTTAKSFPAGIMESHQKLHSLIPFSTDRKYFGISRPEKGGEIVYKAGAEELQEGEAEKFGTERLVLKNGKYICIEIHDYMKDLQGIGNAFQQLLAQPGLDREGCCVEWYVSDKEVKCMIRLEN